MAAAVELAALMGTEQVEEALGLAAVAGRFDDGDLDPRPPRPGPAGTGAHRG
ncbi:MAG: hypothetical protein ACRDKW_02855 [Actinomycetota bacterium]